jgi:hypothetical protein
MASLRRPIREIAARYIPAALLDETIDSFDHGGEKVLITIVPESLRGAVNLG